jgi:hypothetical protein
VKQWIGGTPSAEQRFTAAYRSRAFGGNESASGPGSDLAQTEVIRRELPRVLREVNAKSMLDIPCGDFNWMRLVKFDGVQYIGADVVAELVAENQKCYGGAGREFRQLNLIRDALPAVDVIFCRDCLVHLTTEETLTAIENIRRSGSIYLLTTTFPTVRQNRALGVGWRPLNLQRPPYLFPEPVQLINEHCTENGGAYADKSLALWRIADLAKR